MAGMMREDTPSAELRWTYLWLALAYMGIVVVVWSTAPANGWAAADSRAHFRIVNYFIEHGFDLHYPQDLIAMFPGMHMCFALVARAVGLGHLRFDGSAAFLIQSTLGLLYLSGLYRLAAPIARDRGSLLLIALPVFSSSYILYSWVWPTTDLGSFAFYVWILALLAAPLGSTATTALAQCTLLGLSVFFRQSYAVLGLAPLATAAARWGFDPGRPREDRTLKWTLLPLFVAVAGAAALIAQWGGLVPPAFRWHAAHGVNVVSGVHIVALSGLIAWPVAVPIGRALADSGARVLLAVAAVSLFVALACWLLVPLDWNFGEGRFGSLIWTLQKPLGHHSLIAPFLVSTIAVGCLIWISVLMIAWRSKQVLPELVMFGLVVAGLLLQRMAFQRYVEPQLLLTLGTFAARRPMLRLDRTLILAWFLLYAGLSVVKAYVG